MHRFVMQAIEFEVFGRVQGVFFRKYTKAKAKELNLKGYVMNTERGTVFGVAQGEPHKLAEFKEWLRETGSPSSRIDRCEFKEKVVSPTEYRDFSVKH